jgi:hypothetical protein
MHGNDGQSSDHRGGGRKLGSGQTHLEERSRGIHGARLSVLGEEGREQLEAVALSSMASATDQAKQRGWRETQRDRCKSQPHSPMSTGALRGPRQQPPPRTAPRGPGPSRPSRTPGWRRGVVQKPPTWPARLGGITRRFCRRPAPLPPSRTPGRGTRSAPSASSGQTRTWASGSQLYLPVRESMTSWRKVGSRAGIDSLYGKVDVWRRWRRLIGGRARRSGEVLYSDPNLYT